MPLRVVPAPAGSGLTTYLTSLPGRYILIPTPDPSSWWRLPHALRIKGGSLITAITKALSTFRGTLVIDLPFHPDDFTNLVFAALRKQRINIVIGFEATSRHTILPALETRFHLSQELNALANGCAICSRLAQNRQPDFHLLVHSFLNAGHTRLQAFLDAALSSFDHIIKTRFLSLGGLIEPGLEATIDKATVAVLWATHPRETEHLIETMHNAGLLTRTNDAIHLHKLITSAIHQPPSKHVQNLLTVADTPFLKTARVRLELATRNRKQAINTALTYTRTRGRCLDASTDVTRVLNEWQNYQALDRQEFCVSSTEVEQGLRLLSSALYKAGVYAAGDVVEEAYQIYGRLFVWRARNTVIRRFLIGLELFGGAVRRADKCDSRRVAK